MSRVKVRIRTGYITYNVTEVTLSTEEYHAFRERMDKQDFHGHEENSRAVAEELLEHPTAKHHDTYNGVMPIDSLYDTFQDMDYCD